MFNLDQKYESYVRNGNKKLRIDGVEERLRGYGYTDDGKEGNSGGGAAYEKFFVDLPTAYASIPFRIIKRIGKYVFLSQL